MVQYGLLTLFVASFPLAPLFALLNNMVEIRVDAYKQLTQFRRPVAQRVSDIGVWMEILKALTYIAIVTNVINPVVFNFSHRLITGRLFHLRSFFQAFVIAFSSEFVPRLVHYYTNNYSFDGYLNFTLSGNFSSTHFILLAIQKKPNYLSFNCETEFNTSFYQEGMGPKADIDSSQVEVCHYRAMRNPSNDPDSPHALSVNYWYTIAARLIFVVCFEVTDTAMNKNKQTQSNSWL